MSKEGMVIKEGVFVYYTQKILRIFVLCYIFTNKIFEHIIKNKI